MHEATQILRQEHEVILGVLDATEKTANALEAGSDMPAEVLQQPLNSFGSTPTRSTTAKKRTIFSPNSANPWQWPAGRSA